MVGRVVDHFIQRNQVPVLQVLRDGDLRAYSERESLKQLKVVNEPFWPLGDLNMVFAMNHRLCSDAPLVSRHPRTLAAAP